MAAEMGSAIKALCLCLQQYFSGNEQRLDVSSMPWEEMLALSERNGLHGVLYEAIRCLQVPKSILEPLKKAAVETAVRYYRILQFTAEIAALFVNEKLELRVLKGVGYSVLYPKAESRKLSDLDIYLPCGEDFARACQLLKERGYTQRTSDHSGYHQEFICKPRYWEQPVTLEVHYRVCQQFENEVLNDQIDRLFGSEYVSGATTEVFGLSLPVLEPTQDAYYQLLHMLGHFVTAGFSLRNLWDWTLFLAAREEKICWDKLVCWAEEARIRGFLDGVNQVCIEYLGLSAGCCPPVGEAGRSTAESLLYDAVSGGEFGRYDTSRIWFAVGNHEKGGIFAWIHQLCRETRARYPKLARAYPLYPFLWVKIVVGFLRHNKTERNSSLSTVLDTFSKRSQLYAQLGLFENERPKP